jgi:hypothetical protein
MKEGSEEILVKSPVYGACLFIDIGLIYRTAEMAGKRKYGEDRGRLETGCMIGEIASHIGSRFWISPGKLPGDIPGELLLRHRHPHQDVTDPLFRVFPATKNTNVAQLCTNFTVGDRLSFRCGLLLQLTDG